MTTGEAKQSKWLDQIFELHSLKETLFECLYNVFTYLMTYLTQLTHRNLTMLFARGCHANYKYYVGLNIFYKQYDRIITHFNVLLQLINK